MYTRIKYWRLRKAWTQQNLLREAGVSNQTIVNLEKYGRTPYPATVSKLAKALGISTSEVFTDDPSQADGQDVLLQIANVA